MYIIIYDFGTSSVKTCLFEIDAAIKLVAGSSASYGLYISDDGGAEQDAEEWWAAICATTRELFRKSEVKPSQIEGMAFCSQMQVSVFVDEHGNALRRPMNYLDQKGGPGIQGMRVDENDYLSILHGLGRECLGALCITEPGEELKASYEPVTEQQIRKLAAEGATKSAELVTKSHLSLTGASGKVGLYFDSRNGKWFLPWGTAPSTHIVKQSHVRLDGIVTNEQLALSTAARCGIAIPHSFIINTGAGEEHEVLFATERYDRVFSDPAQSIDGLPRPLRLHQEDFAQAMGIPASWKYERDCSGHMRGMFDILRRYSADPVRDQMRLWDIIVFNYLIGNTDAHVKNFSLLYGPRMKDLRLAPAYDIVSTAVYEQSTRNMAFSIGGVYSIDEIKREHFNWAAKDVGLGERMAMRRFDDMCARFKHALREATKELVSAGFPKAEDMEARILQSGGIKNTSIS